MSAVGATALHLMITEFKFIHNFIICDQLPETELIFGINIQKKFSLSYAWDEEKELLHTKRWQISGLHICNCDHKATIGTVKSTLRIPP